MNGRIFFALFGALLVAGAVVGQGAGPVEDINRLDKARQEAIVNELIKAQEQIQRALKRMLKDSVPVNGQEQPGSDEDGSDETDEEHEWHEMKRKKIAEARGQVERNIRGIASNFIDMGEYIEKIDKKVDEELGSQQANVNYNLYYKKPKPGHHQHHSSEESGERYHYKRRPSRRGSRQLDVTGGDTEVQEATVDEQQPEVVKTVEGEEVVQTLPVEGTE